MEFHGHLRRANYQNKTQTAEARATDMDSNKARSGASSTYEVWWQLGKSSTATWYYTTASVELQEEFKYLSQKRFTLINTFSF